MKFAITLALVALSSAASAGEAFQLPADVSLSARVEYAQDVRLFVDEATQAPMIQVDQNCWFSDVGSVGGCARVFYSPVPATLEIVRAGDGFEIHPATGAFEAVHQVVVDISVAEGFRPLVGPSHFRLAELTWSSDGAKTYRLLALDAEGGVRSVYPLTQTAD
jgi:hypothetical protein